MQCCEGGWMGGWVGRVLRRAPHSSRKVASAAGRGRAWAPTDSPPASLERGKGRLHRALVYAVPVVKVLEGGGQGGAGKGGGGGGLRADTAARASLPAACPPAQWGCPPAHPTSHCCSRCCCCWHCCCSCCCSQTASAPTHTARTHLAGAVRLAALVLLHPLGAGLRGAARPPNRSHISLPAPWDAGWAVQQPRRRGHPTPAPPPPGMSATP